MRERERVKKEQQHKLLLNIERFFLTIHISCIRNQLLGASLFGFSWRRGQQLDDGYKIQPLASSIIG